MDVIATAHSARPIVICCIGGISLGCHAPDPRGGGVHQSSVRLSFTEARNTIRISQTPAEFFERDRYFRGLPTVYPIPVYRYNSAMTRDPVNGSSWRDSGLP